MPRGNSNILCPKIPRIFANKKLSGKTEHGKYVVQTQLATLYANAETGLDETPQLCFRSLFFAV